MAIRRFVTYPAFTRRLSSGTIQFSSLLLQTVARRVSFHVIEGTPVDTGLARSNWLASINVPQTRTRKTIGRGPGAQIAEAVSISRVLKANDIFFLTNNIHHIGELNRGKSPQALPGFIRASIIRGVSSGFAEVGSMRRLV